MLTLEEFTKLRKDALLAPPEEVGPGLFLCKERVVTYFDRVFDNPLVVSGCERYALRLWRDDGSLLSTMTVDDPSTKTYWRLMKEGETACGPCVDILDPKTFQCLRLTQITLQDVLHTFDALKYIDIGSLTI